LYLQNKEMSSDTKPIRLSFPTESTKYATKNICNHTNRCHSKIEYDSIW